MRIHLISLMIDFGSGWIMLSIQLLLILPVAVWADINEYRLLRHLMANYDSSARKFQSV